MLALHAILASALLLSCAGALAMALQSDDRFLFWARLTALLFLANFAVGAIIYPAYRVLVRRDYLDSHAPWAVNLFDIKEDLVLLALPIALMLFTRQPRRFQLFASAALLILVLSSALSAFIVTQVRSI
jgi:L-asparagine transporter-like permease